MLYPEITNKGVSPIEAVVGSLHQLQGGYVQGKRRGSESRQGRRQSVQANDLPLGHTKDYLLLEVFGGEFVCLTLFHVRNLCVFTHELDLSSADTTEPM